MPSYTRRQIVLLLLFVVAAGFGLGVGRWRQAHPDLVEQLEAFDQTAPGSSPTAPAIGSPSPSGASSRPTSLKRFQPTAEPSRAQVGPIDVNQATAADLRRLPGIGPVLAGRIVEAREARGAFTSVEDLRRVAGVGKAKLDRFRSLVTVSR